MSNATDGQPMVTVTRLRKHFPIRRGVLRRQVGAVRAVDNISFEIRRGETLGLVGESGSGKTTTGRVMLALDKPTEGQIEFRGQDLFSMAPEALRQARRDIQFIFQDPYASLNPRMRVGDTIREPLEVHEIGTPDEREARVETLLEMVGMDASHATRFPHEFSGGQRQRIGIARALATEPSFIVADEPISALDVSIQAQIVNLLADLKAKLGLTYLFIAHDLSMVRHLSDRVAVMYLGRLVEIGNVDDIFGTPLHPYTRALIAAMPVAGTTASAGKPQSLQGEIPDPAAPPPGCSFHTRCPFATDECRRAAPELRTIEARSTMQEVACHHAGSIKHAPANKESET